MPRLRTSGSEIHGAADADDAEREVGRGDVGVAHERPDSEVTVVALERIEPGMRLMSTSFAGCREADLHHRQEALAAGEDAGVVAAVRLGRDRLVDRGGDRVIERGWKHVVPPLQHLRARRRYTEPMVTASA